MFGHLLPEILLAVAVRLQTIVGFGRIYANCPNESSKCGWPTWLKGTTTKATCCIDSDVMGKFRTSATGVPTELVSYQQYDPRDTLLVARRAFLPTITAKAWRTLAADKTLVAVSAAVCRQINAVAWVKLSAWAALHCNLHFVVSSEDRHILCTELDCIG
eukprot:COSAG02_NODE_26650_length_628_cov_0.950851_1_plen_159_part_01